MFLGIWAAVRDRRHASAFEREISERQVMSALVIGAVAVVMLFGVLISLTIGLDMAQGPEVEQYRLPKEYVATA